MLLYPSSIDYVIAFYGCLIARVVAVPIHFPLDNELKMVRVINKCQPVLALTTLNELSTVKTFWQEQGNHVKALNIFTSNNSVSLLGDLEAVVELAPRSPAFLHYSFDSAGVTTEVIVTHQDIIETVKQASFMTSEKTADIFVGWLPFSHTLDFVTEASTVAV